MRRVVAILTDFGTKDGFVGAMKGVILSINPEVQLVDISHEVEPFNVLEGALLLKAHFKYFPKGTIFLCVVDPGVGSERLPVVIEGGGYFFVGPMNGIFDLAIKDTRCKPKAHRIENFTLPRVNQTFHGRDVFAPAAGWLSRGVPLEKVGSPVEYSFSLNWVEPEDRGEEIWGRVLYFDRFGNCITNIPCGEYSVAYFRGQELPVISYFLKGERGKPALLCGSFGFMELVVPLGNAREVLKVSLGEVVGVKKL